MDIDIKILPIVRFSLTETGEQLRISLNLQTYNHKVNILGAHIYLVSDNIEIEKNITYIKRYIDPKTNVDLNLNLTITDSESPLDNIIYEFQNKIYELSSKGIDKRNIGFKIKSSIYEIKNEYLEKILNLLSLPGRDFQLKLKVEYDPIKGFLDRFNRESFLIEKSFKLATKDRLKLLVDNFLMISVSKILMSPENIDLKGMVFEATLN